MEKISRAELRNKAAVETLLAKPVRQIPDGGLATLRRKARECRACGLWKHATQTVFGAGADHARIMLIGEQPGMQEDIQGLPFVGPAGGLLHHARAGGVAPPRCGYRGRRDFSSLRRPARPR